MLIRLHLSISEEEIMKNIAVFILLVMYVQLYAQAKWIKIAPKEEKKIQNLKSQPIKNIITNAKIIQELLDKTSKNSKFDREQKNWYIIKSIENN